jgi:hypothetical protein
MLADCGIACFRMTGLTIEKVNGVSCLDYGYEDGWIVLSARAPVKMIVFRCRSCETISNPDLLSSCETVVIPGIGSRKKKNRLSD